jgi:hypothetical protein
MGYLFYCLVGGESTSATGTSEHNELSIKPSSPDRIRVDDDNTALLSQRASMRRLTLILQRWSISSYQDFLRVQAPEEQARTSSCRFHVSRTDLHPLMQKWAHLTQIACQQYPVCDTIRVEGRMRCKISSVTE